MKKYLLYLLTGAALILLQTSPAFSTEDNDDGPDVPPVVTRPARPVQLRARLSGFSEVPALSSPGGGSFRGTINAARTEITYVLTFDDTESPVFMAHIHFGQATTNGGISIWFCGGPPANIPTTVPTGLPACPADGGTLEGTITAEDMIGPGNQGLDVGQFNEFVDAILRGLTYVNVHSIKYPPGEVRGQIQVGRFGFFNP